MHSDIARSITHAANQMHEASSTEEVLDLIVRSAAQALPTFDHIGISTVEKRGDIVNRAATSDFVHELDHLQYGIPEGPCVDSLDGEDVVTAPHLGRNDHRWPQYVPQALQHGLRSQLAVRLHLAAEGTVGGLNLYSTTTDEIPEDEVFTAAFFATHASLALGRAREVSSLAAAIETRQRIGQAIGLLMVRYTLTERAAHAFMWRASSQGNVKVRDIAARLIDEAETQALRQSR